MTISTEKSASVYRYNDKSGPRKCEYAWLTTKASSVKHCRM